MSDVTKVTQITNDLREAEERADNPIPRLTVPPGVEIFEIYGSLFFGAIDRFKEAMKRVEKRPKVLIIRMRNVLSIDATGLQSLEDMLQSTRRQKTALLLSGTSAQPLAAMRQSGLYQRVGEQNILENIDAALRRACNILGLPPDMQTGAAVPPEQ